MKRLLLFLLLASGALSSVAWPVVTQPVDGEYPSIDIGGSVYTGLFSESWAGGTPWHGVVGNTYIISSVDGPAIGTQWEVWCAALSAPPTVLSDTRDAGGTGVVTWSAAYDGGNFWLFGGGPWGDAGADDFHGTVGTMVVQTTFTYESNTVTSVGSTLSMSGEFDTGSWDGKCLEIDATGVVTGTTETAVKPEDYPAFMESGCTPPAAETGAWGSFAALTLAVLDCVPSPVESTTWGAVKSIYAR